MPRRTPRPFGERLEIERGGDGPLGRRVSLARYASVEDIADDLTEGAVGSSLSSLDALPLRRQATLMAGVGLLGVAALWVVRFAAPGLASDFIDQGMRAFGVITLALSCIAAYGVLQLVFDRAHSTAPAADDGRFGSFVAAGHEEGRWKRRLAAAATGVVHTVMYFSW